MRLYAGRDRLVQDVARRILCRATAADLVQDVFLRLWDRAAEWKGDPEAYLRRSARNAAIDYLRARRLREAVAPELAARMAPPAPEAHLEARDALRRLEVTIRALPERSRDIFLLNRVHSCSYSEIARAMGLSSTAVEKHMARALAACRAAVEGEAMTGDDRA
nr:sigma-70 family RNA polymerase sigma factor [Roseomonas sp. GC11]